MYDHRRTPKYRACHPRVESPGGRRLASGTTPGRPGPSIKPEALSGAITRTESRASGHVAEAAPGEARQCDRLGPAREDGGAEPHRRGLAQLARYLARTWSRAGITPQRHDDCSQEVYLSLLEGWGPDRFRRVVGAIDRRGIRGVLGRETAEGPDFYRVIDRVKMRTRRERSCPSLADADAVASPRREDLAMQRRADLHEAFARGLSPREAALIEALLAGETPAEVATRWGITAKTVSNEKARALHKLRGGLLGYGLCL